MSRQSFHPALFVIIALGLSLSHPRGVSAQSDEASPPSPPVVEITATNYAFKAPDEIPSGWSTLRFKNEGDESHFVFMTRLPEGKTIDDYETELSLPYLKGWEALMKGEVDQEGALGMIIEAMPEWFPAVQFVGGPGLAAEGLTTETTVNLEPGGYVLECYMKNEDGELHMMEGMLRPITVTEESTGAVPPDAHVRVTLSNYAMDVEGDLTPGRRTVAVHVAENPEQGFGHSAHLARLDEDADVSGVVQWMNWLDLSGLRTPAPARFLGGIHQMPVGKTAYYTVDLEPGRYAFISEATAHQGVLHEFTVGR